MSNVPPPPPGSTPPPPPPGGRSPGTPPPPPPGAPPPPPGASVPPPPQPGYGQPYGGVPAQEMAGFWVRFGGWLLDGILYGLLYLPFLIAGFALVAVGFDDCRTIDDTIVCNGQEEVGPIVGGIGVFFVGFVVVAFVFLRALARSGQTWGRRIVGIKVVRTDNGLAPGWGKAIGRTLFSYISAWVFYLGFLWMLWDAQKQTWHDKVAGTYVVPA